MRKWWWIVPVLLLAGCSKPAPTGSAPAATASTAPGAAAPAPQPAEAAGNPEPVESAAGDAVPAERGGNPELARRAAGNTRPAERAPEELVIPAGARLRVRLDEALSTRRNRSGDTFQATLQGPVRVEGRTAIPAGTRFTGHVAAADSSGRMKGRAVLAISLDRFEMGGHVYHVRTSRVVRQSSGHKKRNLAFIGGGTGLGAALGAIAGGGKGAAIGALAGAGAGTAGAAATGKLQVGLPAEALLTFSLEAPVRM
jgi:hypothetical protein